MVIICCNFSTKENMNKLHEQLLAAIHGLPEKGTSLSRVGPSPFHNVRIPSLLTVFSTASLTCL